LELAAGLVVADRFRLVRPLGQGGMGAVWLAHHTSLDVPCAVKFIHEEAATSAEIRRRFEREAKAAARLRSPHVVQILDHGVWQGAPYIAMEHLDGEDLAHRLHRSGALSPKETLAVAAQVGRALSKAHAAGLVHRDLKPSNIFLVRDEEREIAKVLDFGVAKFTDGGLDGSTSTGAVLGTPFYMSPEQARGSKSTDHRSDLWALGVVVYRCLTGHLPFRSDAIGDLMVKIIVDPLPVPSQTAQVPPGFDDWWARAAARDPAQRFQSARELTEALGLALGLTAPGGVDDAVSSSGQRGPLASTPSALITPTPPVAAPPTPVQQAISVHVAPARGVGSVVAAVVVALALVSAAAFFAFRGGSAASDGAHAPTASTPPPAAAPPVPSAIAATAATAATAASPDVAPASAAAAPPPGAPPAVPAPVASHAPLPGKAAPGSKTKTDFGF
jgi:serine/threonine protein kinase